MFMLFRIELFGYYFTGRKWKKKTLSMKIESETWVTVKDYVRHQLIPFMSYHEGYSIELL